MRRCCASPRHLGMLLIAIVMRAAMARAQTPPLVAPEWSITPSLGWRFLPSAVLAYDSFSQRYVIGENDTLDLVQEVSGRAVASLERRGQTELRFKNTLGVGQQATRNDLQVELQRRQGSFELRATNEAHLKAYREGSSYVLSSNYLLDQLRTSVTWHPTEQWQLRLEDRSEWTRFARRTTYNYGYTDHDVGPQLERRYGFLSGVRAGYGYGTRSVPDSAGIGYRRHVVVAAWDHDFGLHSLGFEHRLERRHYVDPRLRSHFWDYDGGLDLRLALWPRLRLHPDYRINSITYDLPNSVYSNSSLQSAALLVEADWSERLSLGLGPRGEFQRVQGTADRAYNQWGLKASITYSFGTRLWLQLTDEAGLRQYLAGEDLFFSDYVYNWSSLYLTCELTQRLGLDVFFSHSPENHDKHTNDNSTLLLSSSLTYGLK